MIIVSNTHINRSCNKQYTYAEFTSLIFGDEGIDLNENEAIMINAEDVDHEDYELLKDEDQIKYFSLTGNKKPFVEKSVEVWAQDARTNETSAIDVENDVDIPINNGEKTVVEEEALTNIENLLDDSAHLNDDPIDSKIARMIVFGSSKGGTGKTFTSLISTYRYAKTHQHQKIALVDFDIIDGQVGITIHKLKPTMLNYYKEYQKGYDDFRTLRNFAIKANPPFPQNVDFYLAPNTGQVIDNDDFWMNIMLNCCRNYDVVVFDTGIDYLNITPISNAYKMADKINIITTTSIKSVSSVKKQIEKLKGNVPPENGQKPVFTKDDEIEKAINIIITQMSTSKGQQKINEKIYGQLAANANIIATFGTITDIVTRAEFYGEWNIIDSNAKINETLDRIMS